ncbi:MAG: Asp23/Gls24 family envelope stress response protein [Christensenellales bacterium]|jgi:uncharacterized alkaline shock family protein YloU
MTPENENLSVHEEAQENAGGTITYANEVIAIIAGIAANEVEGIAGMCTSGGFSDIIGKNRNVTRGVKVEVGTEEVSVDLYTVIEYGQPIQKVASEVQENVRKSIEAMTSLKVVRVDVHVQGVSFEKEKREVQTNLENVKRQSLPESSEDKKREDKKDGKKRGKDAPAPVEEAPAEVPVAAVAAEEAPAETPEQPDAQSAEEKAPAQDEPAAEATVQPAADVPSEEPAPVPVEEKPKTTRKTTRRTRKE